MVEIEKEGVEQPKEKTTKQRATDILKRIHFDKLRHLSLDHEELQRQTKDISNILYDAFDLTTVKRWSPALREEYPKGTEVTLVGEKEGQLLKPVTVPLRRPEVFLKMYETYLETGEVPQELIQDDSEEEVPHDEEDADQEINYSEDMQEYVDWIHEANSVDRLIRIKKTAKSEMDLLRDTGVLQLLDEKAEKLILEEIEAGTPDKIQLAMDHINKFTFNARENLAANQEITENLRIMLESQTPREEILQMPSKVSDFEKRAAAAGSIEEIAAIAKSVPGSETRVRRSIDNLAKTKFIEVCKNNASVDSFKETLGEARRFPFFDSQYGEDVRFIVEANAKSFILGKIKKGSTLEELDSIQEKAREFRFTHDENLTDINNEIIIKREGIRGNPLSVQQLPNEETENVSRGARALPDNSTRGLPADRRDSLLRRFGRFFTNENPNE